MNPSIYVFLLSSFQNSDLVALLNAANDKIRKYFRISKPPASRSSHSLTRFVFIFSKREISFRFCSFEMEKNIDKFVLKFFSHFIPGHVVVKIWSHFVVV